MTIKNLDEVYATIKSLSGELRVTGWAASYEGIRFEEADTLLGWFLKNLPLLKAGVKDLPVANAVGDGNGYTIYEDSLTISSEPTSLGLLVVVKVKWYTDNGYHDYSGRYAIENGYKEITFLLKYDE